MKASLVFSVLLSSSIGFLASGGIAAATTAAEYTPSPTSIANTSSIALEASTFVLHRDKEITLARVDELKGVIEDLFPQYDEEITASRSTANETSGTTSNATTSNASTATSTSAKTAASNTSAAALSADTIDVNGTSMSYIDYYNASTAPSTGAGVWKGSDSTTDGSWGYFIGHNPGSFTVVMSLEDGDPITVCDSNGNTRTYHVVDQFTIPNTTYWEEIEDEVTHYGESVILQTCCGDDAHYRIVIAD